MNKRFKPPDRTEKEQDVPRQGQRRENNLTCWLNKMFNSKSDEV